MSGNIWLDWITLSVSIFNTIIMLWMGLMILLSSDKRTWGVWLAAGGLLVGSLFFVSHTAIIGQEISFFTPGHQLLVACGLGAGCRCSVWLVYRHALVFRLLGELSIQLAYSA